MINSSPSINSKTMLSFQMKQLKSELPKSCTYLAPYKTHKGELYVRVIVNKQESLFTIPDSFVFKKADLDELKSQILKKIKEDVSK
jgi:hypothetical protein